MKYAEAAENVKMLVENPPANDEFIYELLLAYGSPKATIARLKSGSINLSKEPSEILLKKKVWFKSVETNVVQASRLPNSEEPSDSKQARLSLYGEIEELKASKKTKSNDPRFLIVTDFEQILAFDRKTGGTLDTDFQGLEIHFEFFLPWAGMEKTKISNENPADVKAAEKMARLFDAIRKDNDDYLRHDAHAMNVFLGRLLFCLFAEDTNIFPENAVSNAIASHTAEDGSDLDAFFKQLFDWLDTSDECRISNKEYRTPKEQGQVLTTEDTENTKAGSGESVCDPCTFCGSELLNLPYVNGGLFRDHYDIPGFSAKSRRMLIEAGSLDWKDINPDIFGSMFQAVIDPEERHNLGQHYTSVTNIMKVIEPLFLNEFKEELERASNLTQKNVRSKALDALHDRIANVKIFDPACGSGNFLIIAYKELRKLEMELFEAQNAFPVSRITVDQFYGIEIDDFACGTAVLALWLSEHQMNLEYEKRFKKSITSLPLKDGANIVQGNATRIDWEEVCPKDLNDEIYVLGNPPYLGSSMQDEGQKADKAHVFNGVKNFKNLDYIACWFFNGADYIAGINAKCALVSTNSICQGEQVEMLWPHVFEKSLEIGFAHQSFLWSNNAKNKAAVYCVIIGIQRVGASDKLIYKNGVSRSVRDINAYLVESSFALLLHKRRSPISQLPVMTYGSKATCGSSLILSEIEREELLKSNPDAAQYIRKLTGGEEFIKGQRRWCVWIDTSEYKNALSISALAERIDRVQVERAKSKKAATRLLAATPYAFGEIRYKNSNSIIVPATTSERRDYIPMGFLDSDTIVTNSAHVVYDATPVLFGVLSSKAHMVWMRSSCGRLKSDYRYSSALCYNTFPISDLTEGQKQTITMHVGNVLQERENESGKTMAQLYDPDKMPAGLREAHHNLDLAVDRLYRSKPFTSDEERLEHLFKLYEEMTAKVKLI